VKSAIRLPMSYDEARLIRDLEAAKQSREFIVNGPKTINGQPYHDGRWKAIALVALDGKTDASGLRWAGTNANYQKTTVMKGCPYFEEIVDSFRCPVQRVRLLQLEPGAQIHTHSDLGDGWAMRKVRLHVPILTNDQMFFFVDGERVIMRPGELWYCDFTRPHSVHNRGETARVHMVLDLTVNDWLRDVFPAESLLERVRGFGQRARFHGQDRLRKAAGRIGLGKIKRAILGQPERSREVEKFD
jgi:Aspartyl/Asparaginyl beta-hydroxylase